MAQITTGCTRRWIIPAGLIASIGTAFPQGTSANSAGAVRTRRPRLDLDVINEFVSAGHGNLPRVKEMLAQIPQLVFAERDLGGGDLETALGGASHMGNREIARYLISQGSRIDTFCLAMLGQHEAVLALLKAFPETATTKGPHGYTLLYHAAISGNIRIAEGIQPLLPPAVPDYNQALTAAARDGHLPMIQWLLANGVTDINAADGVGNTALKYAIKKEFPDVAEALRKHGAAEPK